jgi:hypothetical protein
VRNLYKHLHSCQSSDVIPFKRFSFEWAEDLDLTIMTKFRWDNRFLKKVHKPGIHFWDSNQLPIVYHL